MGSPPGARHRGDGDFQRTHASAKPALLHSEVLGHSARSASHAGQGADHVSVVERASGRARITTGWGMPAGEEKRTHIVCGLWVHTALEKLFFLLVYPMVQSPISRVPERFVPCNIFAFFPARCATEWTCMRFRFSCLCFTVALARVATVLSAQGRRY